jgi:oligopeptide transport system substrate-binding protein
LTEWKHEYKLSLAANPYYYGDRPECREVELYVINEKSTALTLYESGGLDLVSLPPEAIPHYRGTREYINQPELRGYYYGFNVRRPPFNDVRVRKAFSLAIDREQFPRILKGGEKPARSWIPPGLFGYDPEIGLRFNPAEAVRLLAEAGFPGGKGFPDVTLAFNTDAVNSLIAENVQAQIKKNLNIVLRLDNMEWKVYLKRLQLDPPPLFRLGWGADFPDPDNFMNLFLSGGGNNHTGWADPAYDLLVSRGAYEADPERRTRIYHDAQVLLTEREIPIMPLFVSAQNFLLRDGIEGLETNPMELIFFKKIRVVR